MNKNRKIIFPLISIIILLIILEFGSDLLIFSRNLIFYFHQPQIITGHKLKNPDEVKWEDSDYIRGRFVPAQRDVFLTTTISKISLNINNYGLRGAPVTEKKKIRLLCIGDSVTFGWGASADSTTYPYFLSRELSDLNIEVINAGMPRFNSMDLLDLYITKLILLKPDYIILLAGWNDLAYEMVSVKEKASVARHFTFSTLLAESFNTVKCANIIKEKLQSLSKNSKKITFSEEQIINQRENARDDIRWESFDEYERILNSFISLIQNESTVPILLTLPNFLNEKMSFEEKKTMLPHLLKWNDVSYNGWRLMVDRANNIIRKVASERQVFLIDIDKKIEYKYFVDVCHLNDEGNRLFADLIADKIKPFLISTKSEKKDS
jgi:lysophospholipase L1-like esterase